jgi:hypothetical protein
MKGRCLKAVAQISRLCNPPKTRQTEEVMIAIFSGTNDY